MSWYCLWISIWRATPARRIGGNTSAYLHLAHFASNESIFRGPFIFYGTVSPSQGSKKCSDVSMHICYSRGVLEPRVTHRSLVIFLFAYVRDGFLYSFPRHGIIAANAQHNWLKSFPGLCFCKGVLILSL